jgi:hypothetical protein
LTSPIAAATVAAVGTATALAAQQAGDALVEVAPELVEVGTVVVAGRFFGPFVAVTSVILILAVVVLRTTSPLGSFNENLTPIFLNKDTSMRLRSG